MNGPRRSSSSAAVFFRALPLPRDGSACARSQRRARHADYRPSPGANCDERHRARNGRNLREELHATSFSIRRVRGVAVVRDGWCRAARRAGRAEDHRRRLRASGTGHELQRDAARLRNLGPSDLAPGRAVLVSRPDADGRARRFSSIRPRARARAATTSPTTAASIFRRTVAPAAADAAASAVAVAVVEDGAADARRKRCRPTEPRARSSATGICGCATSPPGSETQLTTDGVKDFGYATDNAGWQNSDRAILLWSPDSKKIATFQQDQRNVGEMYLVSTKVGHPELRTWKYPLPGDSVVTMIHRVIIDVERRDAAHDPPADARRPAPLDALRRYRLRGGSWSDVEWYPDGSHARVRVDVARPQARGRCASPTPPPARFATCSRKRRRRTSNPATAA